MSIKQRNFLKDYKEIQTEKDYKEVMENYNACLQFDERYGIWEVFIPSNGRTQAIMFELQEEDLCGHEEES